MNDSASIPGSLGPDQRAAALETLATTTVDVLVIGGGVTGVGCALDAASRGLSVALVEQRDLAAGTSSRSSKLLHGGLRYLQQFDFGLVLEALRERGRLATIVCPNLVRPISFLLPLKHRVWQRIYFGAGVLLYDIMAATGVNPLPRHRHLSKKAAMALAPALDPTQLIGAILYFDAQIDDARHTVAVARTAANYGATIATSMKVVGLLKEEGKVVGAELEDVETGRSITARARRVVNATGVWIDDVQEMAGPSALRVKAAKGIHIVIPKDRIASDTGIILETEKSVLFIIPWGDHWLIGTTDTAWTHDRAHPAASAADIDYVLEHANQALEHDLTRADIIGVYAGLRPLVSGEEDEDTAKISREHAVAQPVPGLVTIAGGKYTTYRIMAQDTIDVAVEGLTPRPPPSITSDLPLIGSENWDLWSKRGPELAARHNLELAVVEALLGRHGSRIGDVLAIATEKPGLSDRLPGGPYIAAEVVYAARHEGALHLDDVLTRRMRLSFEAPDRGVAAASIAAELMGAELGWDDGRVQVEIAAWQQRVAAELAANLEPDDASADRTRRKAVDSRGMADAQD